MTAELLGRSPLANHPLAAAGDVHLAELAFRTAVNLRVDPDGDVATRIAEAIGVPLPAAGDVAETGERAVLWLGPDEWLVVGPDGDAGPLVETLTDAIAGAPGSVVDVSANRTTIEVSGPLARDLLEKGCTLDLHPRAFLPGRCAQTMLARAQVVLWQTNEDPTYRLMVRASFAPYLADWLVDAAREYAVTLP